jgi:O-acetylhomoserine/O-acetylserine sulfhydrylase-like pyridoxal-dependent enzyme
MIKHTIQIEKDGWVSVKSAYGSARGYQEKGLGDIGVDVEVVDLRDTFERWVDPVQQERTRIIGEVENMVIETVGNSQKTVEQIINIIKNL